MELEKYISSLLRNHNCVIVPEFGGFIANYKSAVVDESRNMIHPPSKSILFNKNLINNDGLLGQAVSEKESISYDKALQSIEKKIETWNKALRDGERIEIGEIGFLCQQNGTLFFEQNREVNILLNAYGLSSINFVQFEQEIEKIEITDQAREKVNKAPIRVIKEQKENTPIIQFEKDSKIEEIQEAKESDQSVVIPFKPKSNTWKYIAVAAAIPFLFYSYWIPMETDFLNTGQIQFSDFNPIHSQENKVYETRDNQFNLEMNEEVRSWDDLTENLSENVQVYNYQFDEELYIPVRLTTDVLINDLQTDSDEIYSSDDTYYLISGCFSVENNANNLVSDLKENGYSARILDKNNGLHRVTSGGFSDKKSADEALDKLRNQGFDAWILKK